MAKKSGLGNKFASIFDDDPAFDSAEEREGIVTLKIGEIEPNKDQPRKEFDPDMLNRLAESITKHGVIQPLTVREKDGAYQIVAGERRWRAAKIAGLSEVPVRIMELSDSETAQIALIENLQREDLNPIEEANGYKQLTEKYGLKQEEIAAVNDEVKQLELAHKTVKEQLSVRQLEGLCKASSDKPKKRAAERVTPAFFTEAEISLKELTGQPVKITPKKYQEEVPGRETRYGGRGDRA